MPQSNNVYVKRASDVTLKFTLFTRLFQNGKPTDDDTAIDLSSSTVYFTVRKNKDKKSQDELDNVIEKDITVHVSPLTGITEVSLDSTDTDLDSDIDYVYNIQYKDPSGLISKSQPYPFLVSDGLSNRV